MKPILLSALLLLSGCSGVLVRVNGDKKTVVGASFLTDRNIGEMTYRGTSSEFQVKDAQSEQSRALAAIEAALKLKQ